MAMDRRDALKGLVAAGAGAAVWTTPVISSPVYAQATGSGAPDDCLPGLAIRWGDHLSKEFLFDPDDWNTPATELGDLYGEQVGASLNNSWAGWPSPPPGSFPTPSGNPAQVLVPTLGGLVGPALRLTALSAYTVYPATQWNPQGGAWHEGNTHLAIGFGAAEVRNVRFTIAGIDRSTIPGLEFDELVWVEADSGSAGVIATPNDPASVVGSGDDDDPLRSTRTTPLSDFDASGNVAIYIPGPIKHLAIGLFPAGNMPYPIEYHPIDHDFTLEVAISDITFDACPVPPDDPGGPVEM